MLRERALRYVAASRARDELVISFSGAPSPLLPEQDRTQGHRAQPGTSLSAWASPSDDRPTTLNVPSGSRTTAATSSNEP